MKRSKFSLSNYKLLSCDMGELVPIGIQEVLPGDTFQHSTSALIRVSPLLSPVMHPVQAKIHHWFVPTRIIWDDFEKFITGGPDGMDATVWPQMNFPTTTGYAVGSLADYLGIPTGVDPGGLVNHSALPFRAYQLIFNEWYRDQDLVTAAAISRGNGNDTTTSTSLQNAAWEKDYFTTARPFSQKGPEVSIPLEGETPVLGIGIRNEGAPGTYGSTRQSDGTEVSYTGWEVASGAPGANQTNLIVEENADEAGYPGIRATMTGASIDVNDLREGLALQRYQEARARYGSRYTEYLRYLGVRSSDARLQRPEYLGGGKQTIQFSEVLQTSPTTDGDDTEGVGNMKGHGIGAMRSNRYRRFFEEHGFVITLLVVRPKTMYVQGLPRMWQRVTKEDYHQKELEHIGQQEVKNAELYIAHSNPNDRFGWQDRYDEYRRCESTVAGEFRTTLDYWHMARIFGSEPTLNGSFVTSVPTKRVNAVQTDDVLWIMANHSIQARRNLSKIGTSYIY